MRRVSSLRQIPVALRDDQGPRTVYARCVLEMPVLAEFFRAIDGLVPIPPNEPGRPSQEYLPKRLADALVAEGLARTARRGLSRVSAVPKSAAAAPGRRARPLRRFERRAPLRAAG
jgi:hypothetical protein